MNILIITNYSDVSEYINQVKEAADANKDIFGFLPENAYESQAVQNKLWIYCQSKIGSF